MKRGCGFLLFSDWAPVLSEFRLRATVGGMTHLRAMPKRLLALLMMSLVLTGCANRGTPLSPQTLTFNYAVRTVPDAAALIASVRSGQAVVSDLLARDPCNFTADFSSPTPPQVFTNGVPGQTGFNVNIVSTAPVNLATTNPPSCTALDEFEINIGGLSEALALGIPTGLTNGRVWLVDGRQFGTSQYFQARVQGFEAASRRSNGDFQFIDRLSPSSNTVLIVEGSYALTP